MRLSHGIPLRGKQLSNKVKIVSAVSSVSGAANDHNTAFFRKGQFFFYIYIYIIQVILYWKILGTQICGLHTEVIGQTPLYLVLWVNIPGAYLRSLILFWFVLLNFSSNSSRIQHRTNQSLQINGWRSYQTQPQIHKSYILTHSKVYAILVTFLQLWGFSKSLTWLVAYMMVVSLLLNSCYNDTFYLCSQWKSNFVFHKALL